MMSAGPLQKGVLALFAVLLTSAFLTWALPSQLRLLANRGDSRPAEEPALHISLAAPQAARATEDPSPRQADGPSKADRQAAKQEPEPEPEPELELELEPILEPEPKPEQAPEPNAQTEPQAKPAQPPEPDLAIANVEKPTAEPAKPGGPPEAIPLQKAGPSEAVDRYLSRLVEHLRRFYRYPTQARRLGHEGTPEVIFEFRRDGSLVFRKLGSASGHEGLDQAALDFLTRASPLPAVPDTMTGDRFTYVLPVSFRLR